MGTNLWARMGHMTDRTDTRAFARPHRELPRLDTAIRAAPNVHETCPGPGVPVDNQCSRRAVTGPREELPTVVLP